MINQSKSLSFTESKGFTIRSAIAADLPHLADLDCLLYPIEGGWSLENFEYDFSQPGRLYLVVQNDDDIIGYSACSVEDGFGELTMNSVVPAWRGRGIGRLLLEIRLHWLDQFVSDVYLQTRVDNELVLRSYTHYGFLPNRHLPDYYGPGVDAIELYRHLSLSSE
jgi:ribosomal-protein-alanine N-acetyltransferase